MAVRRRDSSTRSSRKKKPDFCRRLFYFMVSHYRRNTIAHSFTMRSVCFTTINEQTRAHRSESGRMQRVVGDNDAPSRRRSIGGGGESPVDSRPVRRCDCRCIFFTHIIGWLFTHTLIHRNSRARRRRRPRSARSTPTRCPRTTTTTMAAVVSSISVANCRRSHSLAYARFRLCLAGHRNIRFIDFVQTASSRPVDDDRKPSTFSCS